jgi:diguanylate cyclase
MELFSAYKILTNDLLCLTDSKGVLLEINENWIKSLGRQKEDYLGHRFIEFVHSEDVKSTIEASRQVYLNSPPLIFENRYLHEDGSYRWFSWKSMRLSEDLFLGLAEDKTIQRRNELTLEHIENNYLIGFWEIDLVTRTLYWSDQTYRIHDLEPQSYIPKLEDGLNFYPSEATKILAPAVDLLMQKGVHFNLELPLITAKKRQIWVQTQATAKISSNGHVNKVLGTIRDISHERRKNQNAQFILNAGKIRTWDWNLNENIFWFSTNWSTLLGTPLNQNTLHRSDWESFIHVDDKDKVITERNRHLNGETSFYRSSYRIRNAAGEYLHILDQGQITDYDLQNKPTRLSGFQIDISELKQLENEKEMLQKRQRFVLNAIKFGYWEWDVKENILFWDDRMYEIFHLNRKDFSGVIDAWSQIISPYDRDRIQEEVRLAFESDSTPFDTTFRIKSPNHATQIIASKGYVERNETGEPIRKLQTFFSWTNGWRDRS